MEIDTPSVGNACQVCMYACVLSIVFVIYCGCCCCCGNSEGYAPDDICTCVQWRHCLFYSIVTALLVKQWMVVPKSASLYQLLLAAVGTEHTVLH